MTTEHLQDVSGILFLEERHISIPVVVLFSKFPTAAELNLNGYGYIGMHFPPFGVKHSSLNLNSSLNLI